MFKETKKRTVTKVISWRLVATINSYVVLLIFVATGSLLKAILMNISGFILFYVFERIWNNIQWGKIKESDEEIEI